MDEVMVIDVRRAGMTTSSVPSCSTVGVLLSVTGCGGQHGRESCLNSASIRHLDERQSASEGLNMCWYL